MNCFKCRKKAAVSVQGGAMCGPCFSPFFERKAARTIRSFKLLEKGGVVCVAASGGKDSLAVLEQIRLWAKSSRSKFFAVCIDEGLGEYRKRTIADLKKYCKENSVDLRILSFKESYGFTLPEALKIISKKRPEIKPCRICSPLRRKLLNDYAKSEGATKIATGHNLDDECQAILMNQLNGSPEFLARLGPKSGAEQKGAFVPRIKPLYLCASNEVEAYVKEKGWSVHLEPCPNARFSYRLPIKRFLNEMEERWPGTKTSLVKSFLKTLPLLKREFKAAGEMNSCKNCGRPCLQDNCSCCEILSILPRG